MKKLKSHFLKNKENYKPALWFVFKIGLAYGIWKSFFYAAHNISFLQRPWQQFTDWVAHFLVVAGGALLGTFLKINVETQGRFIIPEGMAGVEIANHCLAISAMSIFTLFILIYEGKWIEKICFILFGIIAINATNIFRIVGLCLLQMYTDKAFFQFNHSYTYLVITYGTILFLLIFWINHVSKRLKN